MRNFAILGASALVLALGVAQASADNQSNGQSWNDYVARTSAQPAYTGELRDFGALPVDQYAAQAPDQQTPYAPAYRHGATH